MRAHYETIILEKRDGFARIVLNRPQVLNAFNLPMLQEIQAALRDCEDDSGVAAVILTGTGRAFCTGRDMKWRLETAGSTSGEEDAGHLAAAFGALAGFSKPLIGAVNGYCMTGGLEMLLHCDIIIASEKAVFADNHARYGLHHGGGGSQRLAWMVGAVNASYILLTSEQVSAQEALRMGLVVKVVPPEELDAAAEGIARKILGNSPNSVRTIKHLMVSGLKLGLAAGLELEATSFRERSRAGLTEEAKARLQSFLTKKS